MKSDHYLVIWEGYPLKKDYTWEPIENLYDQEELAKTYEKWLKTENERLDSREETERKTNRNLAAQKGQDAAVDKLRRGSCSRRRRKWW